MIRRTFLKGAAAVSFSLMVSPALTAFAKDSVRVYVGGPIFTMNKNNDIAEAIAVKGETILAVGKKAEVMAAAGSGATVVDLKGKALIPGMIDGHSHFPSGAFNELTMVNLNVPPLGRAESIADMQSLLKAVSYTHLKPDRPIRFPVYVHFLSLPIGYFYVSYP